MVHVECETCGYEMDNCEKCDATLCDECFEEDEGLCSSCGERCEDCDELVDQCDCEEQPIPCPCANCNKEEGHVKE